MKETVIGPYVFETQKENPSSFEILTHLEAFFVSQGTSREVRILLAAACISFALVYFDEGGSAGPAACTSFLTSRHRRDTYLKFIELKN